MPQFTVPITGPDGGQGTITVNASDADAALKNAYQGGNTPTGAATLAGGSIGSGPTSTTGPANLGGGDNIGYASSWASQAVLQAANDRAQQAYLQGMLQYNNDRLAFDKATQAFNETIATAQQTGMYQGAPTQAAMQYYANTFGTWGAPTAGQQSLASQQQAFNQQQALAQMYGQYYAPGQAPTAGAQTLAAQQAQQDTAQRYLTLLSQLRGPADWAQYQKVLGATPGGMSDLVRAAAGQYIPGGGATTGTAPTPVSLQSFVGGIGQSQPNQQAAMNALVPPNQMAPQTWNALTPSQQQVLLGTWESQGYTQQDAQALFNQSLPKYGGQAPSAGSFRLQ